MKTIAKPYQSTIDIKKSKFICRLYLAQNEMEAKEIISRISEEFKDATHNCSAYLVSDGEGYDDDGEPGGTAGRPMLNVLKKNNLQNSVAVVTRYFGGIKLGAGGLVRAYSKSVLETLAVAEIVEMEAYELFKVTFSYPDIKSIDNDVRSQNLAVTDKEYDSLVRYTIATANAEQINGFKEKYNDKIQVEYLGRRYLEKMD